MEKSRHHILVRILSYSLIVVAVLVILFVFYTGFNLAASASSGPETALFSRINGVFLPLFFSILLIVDLVFLLNRKKWAYVLFFLLGLFLFLVLVLNRPIDWISLTILTLVLVVFGLFGQLKPVSEEKKELSSDNLEKDLNNT